MTSAKNCGESMPPLLRLVYCTVLYFTSFIDTDSSKQSTIIVFGSNTFFLGDTVVSI